ncbi:ABC transporter, ATP-binding protein [Lachnospiraceae bacterium KM106-2]|nr:ABC transporter, ATP-binding protein [Lachnospiraceae bacterium KM106-2]
MKESKERGLMDHAGNYRYITYLGCFLSGISAVVLLLPFISIYQMADEVLKAMPHVENAKNLTHYGWMAVVYSVLGIIIYFLALICTHIAAFKTAANMRKEAIHHMVQLPLGYFSENGSGKIRRVINESSGQTETYLAHIMPDVVGGYVTPIAMVVMLMVFDWRLGLLSLVPIAISAYFCNKMMGSGLADAMKEYQNALENMNNEAVEYVRGIPVVKTFGQTVHSFESFHDAIVRYKKWAVNYTIRLRVPMCGFTVSINSVFALLVPAAILFVASATNPRRFLSDFIFYVIFTPVITVVMNKLMFSSENRIIAKDATKRINAILDEKPLTETKSSKQPRNFDISFHDVTFRYPETDQVAIDKVSFRVKQGMTVGLVGPSGGGKSTLVSLIPRFYDVDSGSIKIGGADIKEISNEDLMNDISFVFQNTNLFQMSLLDNIRFSKPQATREEVLQAAKAAQCEEIINKLPNGLDTMVGAGGIYLSGGEAQRIALARAILKNAPIVILDEATAFADPENEAKIQKAFETLTRGKTVIMIAHRLSTIKNADQIYVVQNGTIVEEGKHGALLKKDGVYAGMWKEYEQSIAWKVKEEAC